MYPRPNPLKAFCNELRLNRLGFPVREDFTGNLTDFIQYTMLDEASEFEKEPCLCCGFPTYRDVMVCPRCDTDVHTRYLGKKESARA